MVRGVIVVVMVSVVGTIPRVVVPIVVGVTSPIGRIPSPRIVVAVGVAIVVGVVTIAVAVVVGVIPAAEHVGNVARLYPHLIAHDHHGVECGVVGQREEVGVTVAEIPIGGGHTIGQRGETLQTTRIGATIVIDIDVVVDVHIRACCSANRCNLGIATFVGEVSKNLVDIGLGIGCGNHSSYSLLVGGPRCGLLFGPYALGLTKCSHIVDTIEIVDK